MSDTIPKDIDGRFWVDCSSTAELERFALRNKSQDMDLLAMACQFQVEHFSDFTLQDFKEEMQKVQVLRDNEPVLYYSDSIGDEYGNPDLFDPKTCWVFRYYDGFTDSTVGGTDYDRREILIAGKLKNNTDELTSVLLHEMIHAYELDFFDSSNIVNPTFQYICLMRRDYLMIKLMQELKMNEKPLHNALREGAAHGLGNIGHTPFFALKSMQLDKKLNLKSGTIMGYGREAYY